VDAKEGIELGRRILAASKRVFLNSWPGKQGRYFVTLTTYASSTTAFRSGLYATPELAQDAMLRWLERHPEYVLGNYRNGMFASTTPEEFRRQRAEQEDRLRREREAREREAIAAGIAEKERQKILNDPTSPLAAWLIAKFRPTTEDAAEIHRRVSLHG